MEPYLLAAILFMLVGIHCTLYRIEQELKKGG